jgi:hypothetical protein
MVDVCPLAVRTEDHLRGPIGGLDAIDHLAVLPIDNRGVVPAADGDPELLTVGRDEPLAGRATDVAGGLDLVARCIDHLRAVRGDAHRIDETTVPREAEPVDVHLVRVHGTEHAVETTLAQRDRPSTSPPPSLAEGSITETVFED